jgi:hypothetical protein
MVRRQIRLQLLLLADYWNHFTGWKLTQALTALLTEVRRAVIKHRPHPAPPSGRPPTSSSAAVAVLIGDHTNVFGAAPT